MLRAHCTTTGRGVGGVGLQGKILLVLFQESFDLTINFPRKEICLFSAVVKPKLFRKFY